MSKKAKLDIRNTLMEELGERVYASLWHENWTRNPHSL